MILDVKGTGININAEVVETDPVNHNGVIWKTFKRTGNIIISGDNLVITEMSLDHCD